MTGIHSPNQANQAIRGGTYVTPQRVIDALTGASSLSDQILGNPPFSGAASTSVNA